MLLSSLLVPCVNAMRMCVGGRLQARRSASDLGQPLACFSHALYGLLGTVLRKEINICPLNELCGGNAQGRH
jgi:hypothetical protein